MSRYPGQLVFGLDIGTRSIVGTVGYKEKDNFYVIAQRYREHETRAMLDGQIHDIKRVGQTIREVKNELEAVAGRQLTDVCIAAAGRVLRTVNVHVEQEFEKEKEITAEDIFALDSHGVEKAYEEFQPDDTRLKFYCVGYSVIRYYMNDYPISNLEQHKAGTIAADMIATFLPDDVVDGLYKAVECAGLQVANMTLEPIAAIQVAIPEMFRMLNIALVDVGAGTSDISITKDGSIVAYGMIPVAGDSLTELIAKSCLVDFNTAEQIKREACEKELIEYKDIMGLSQQITSEEVCATLEQALKDMTKQVSDKIKELNGDKPVSAVFVVGGGGKVPGYTKLLAEELGIQKERVALRGEEVMQNVVFLERETKKDSLLVTPVGICLTFYMQSNNFIFVSFNGQRIKLYDNSKLAIVDAAIQAGLPNDALFPKRGKELNFTVGGKARIIRGSLGEAAVITLNGEEKDMYAPIKANDVIVVRESTAGDPAHAEIRELPEYNSVLRVRVDGQLIELPKFASVNASLQSGYYEIQENDEIEMLDYYTVGQILEFMDVHIDTNQLLLVNNEQADLGTKVYENFSVVWTLDEEMMRHIPQPAYAQLEEDDGEAAEEERERPGPDQGKEAQEAAEEAEPVEITVMANGRPVKLKGKAEYVFVDIFDYISFDLSKPQGTGVATRLNGRSAEYMEPVHNGDTIEIFWQK